ncbi:TPA: hypothetical protein ENX78_20365 [Candidatus Poribacteria bacterium]|nr:hypothetical protein [Candidatus Poribacteria bacterium]
MSDLEPEKTKIPKRMLPILMKPYVLIILIVISVFGEVLWMYRAIQDGNQLESFGLFLVGMLLGGINGVWTYRVFDKYYIQSLLNKVNVIRQPMSIKNNVFTFLALGVPMAVSFLRDDIDPFLPIMQSYIFGFICGMNVMLYLWARKLPD